MQIKSFWVLSYYYKNIVLVISIIISNTRLLKKKFWKIKKSKIHFFLNRFLMRLHFSFGRCYAHTIKQNNTWAVLTSSFVIIVCYTCFSYAENDFGHNLTHRMIHFDRNIKNQKRILMGLRTNWFGVLSYTMKISRKQILWRA